MLQDTSLDVMCARSSDVQGCTRPINFALLYYFVLAAPDSPTHATESYMLVKVERSNVGSGDSPGHPFVMHLI